MAKTNPADFDTTEMKAATARGRALVDVRRPDVHRHHRELEADAEQDQQHPRPPASVSGPRAATAARMASSVVVPVAVYTRRKPVEQDPRGERADDQVLDARLQGAVVLLGDARRGRRG